MPYFAARWHWDYGHPEIWGPVTGVQATNGTTWLNIYIMSVVIICPKRRLLAVTMITIGTIFQYVLCWEMFMKASIRYLHFIDLVCFGFTMTHLIYLCRNGQD
jgi:hypothetical protein